MEFKEFTGMLIESLSDEAVKSALRKMLSDASIAEDIAKYEEQIKTLEEAAAAKDDEISTMQLQLNKAKLDAAERDRKVSELTEALAAGETSAKASADKIESLTAKIEELTAQAEKAQSDIAERDSRISSMTAAQAAGDSNAKASADKIDALTAKIEELTAQLEKSKSDIADRDNRISEMTAAQAAGDSSAKAAADQIEALRAKVSEAEAEAAKAKEEASSKDSAASELNSKIAELTAAKAEADEKLAQQTAELDSRGVQIEALKEKAAALEEEKLSAKAVADEALSKAAVAGSRLSEIADSLEKTRALVSERDAVITELNAQREEDSRKMESLRSMNENLSNSMNEFNAAISERDEKIELMKKQLQAMLVLKQKINEYAETANAYAEEVERSRAIVAERDGAILELNHNVSRLTEALQTKEQQLVDSSNYATSLETQMNEFKNVEGELNAQINTLRNELEAGRKSVEGYKSTFGSLTDMYDKYGRLSPKTKVGLDENQVFPEGLTVRSFLSCGAQWGHIQALWEYAQTRIVQEDFTDAAILNELFEYFLDFYNSSLKSPQYEIFKPKPGDTFDEELHDKVMTREERKAAFFGGGKKDTAPVGPVKETVLVGYKNLKNGRVMQKSIVRV